MLDEEVNEFINKWKDSIYRDGDITESFREDLKVLIKTYSDNKLSELIEKLGGFRQVSKILEGC